MRRKETLEARDSWNLNAQTGHHQALLQTRTSSAKRLLAVPLFWMWDGRFGDLAGHRPERFCVPEVGPRIECRERRTTAACGTAGPP